MCQVASKSLSTGLVKRCHGCRFWSTVGWYGKTPWPEMVCFLREDCFLEVATNFLVGKRMLLFCSKDHMRSLSPQTWNPGWSLQVYPPQIIKSKRFKSVSKRPSYQLFSKKEESVEVLEFGFRKVQRLWHLTKAEHEGNAGNPTWSSHLPERNA